MTNRPESSSHAKYNIDIGAGIQVGVAAAQTFLGQLLAFYGMAMAFAARRGAQQLRSRLVDELRGLPQQCRLVDLHDQRSEALAPF